MQKTPYQKINSVSVLAQAEPSEPDVSELSVCNSSFNSSLNQWTCIDEKGTNTGESSQTFNENAIVDGVGSYANGLSSGMSDNIVGSAPFSDANSLSVNMDVLDRTEDTPN